MDRARREVDPIEKGGLRSCLPESERPVIGAAGQPLAVTGPGNGLPFDRQPISTNTVPG